MSVIPLTIFFSLLLAGFFMVLFAHSQRRRSFASSESDSLLPLADEQPRVARLESQTEPEVEREPPARFERLEHPPATRSNAHDGRDEADHVHGDHDHTSHSHDDATCGCRSGKRAPCPGCLKRPAQPTSPSL